jgi:hypothetical protein
MLVIWEIVNSIYLECTYINLPNLGSSSFLTKYISGLITKNCGKSVLTSGTSSGGPFSNVSPRVFLACTNEHWFLLPLARRKSQSRFCPLEQSAFAIANRAADLQKRWTLASHPCFGQPRGAQAQYVSRIFCGQQTFGAVRFPSGFED